MFYIQNWFSFRSVGDVFKALFTPTLTRNLISFVKKGKSSRCHLFVLLCFYQTKELCLWRVLRTAIMPKINHRNSVFVITLINHIYQLMTILQRNEIMLVCVINHIWLKLLTKDFSRMQGLSTKEGNKQLFNCKDGKRTFAAWKWWREGKSKKKEKRQKREMKLFFHSSLPISPLFLCVKAINFTLIVIFSFLFACLPAIALSFLL